MKTFESSDTIPTDGNVIILDGGSLGQLSTQEIARLRGRVRQGALLLVTAVGPKDQSQLSALLDQPVTLGQDSVYLCQIKFDGAEPDRTIDGKNFWDQEYYSFYRPAGAGDVWLRYSSPGLTPGATFLRPCGTLAAVTIPKAFALSYLLPSLRDNENVRTEPCSRIHLALPYRMWHATGSEEAPSGIATINPMAARTPQGCHLGLYSCVPTGQKKNLRSELAHRMVLYYHGTYVSWVDSKKPRQGRKSLAHSESHGVMNDTKDNPEGVAEDGKYVHQSDPARHLQYEASRTDG